MSCQRRILCVLAFGALFAAARAHAGPIQSGVYYSFSFSDATPEVRGCAPEDALGDFCIPGFETPTQNLDAPPWTFTFGRISTLTIVDAFLSGDRFEVFNFGVSLGVTSIPAVDADCGDDPLACLAEPGMSRLKVTLPAGSYSLTLSTVAAPNGSGSGYLHVAEAPEPATVSLAGAVLFTLAFAVRRKQ